MYCFLFRKWWSNDWILLNSHTGKSAFNQLLQPMIAALICVFRWGGSPPLSGYNSATGEIPASTLLVSVYFVQPASWMKKTETCVFISWLVVYLWNVRTNRQTGHFKPLLALFFYKMVKKKGKREHSGLKHLNVWKLKKSSLERSETHVERGVMWCHGRASALCRHCAKC